MDEPKNQLSRSNSNVSFKENKEEDLMVESISKLNF